MIGYPLDSHVEFDENNIPVYDRAVSSAPLRKLIKKLFSDGVMPNPSTNLQVAASTGMNIVVKPGFSICNGCMKLEEEQVTLALNTADTSYGRIDTVVLRLDDNDSVRSCELAVLTGTPAASPVRPELTQNASVWEIGLADIKVSAGATAVTNANITDTRYETARCGVISSISEFDTTTLYQQILADLESFKTNEQADFLAWFDEMKNQLSKDAAGNLQNQINIERARINALTKMEEGSTTGDAELRDIRVGADGITYETAGEAVRTQFRNSTEKMTMVEEFLGVGPVVRHIEQITAENATCPRNGYIDIQEIAVGVQANRNMIVDNYGDINEFADMRYVSKDQECVFPESLIAYATGGRHGLVVTNDEFFVTEIITVGQLKENGYIYKVPEDGYVFAFFPNDNGIYYEIITYEKEAGCNLATLVLYSEDAETYTSEATYGDEALAAILSGRQILVRVPNASGDNYVATYSPVLTYQLPNQDNEYLYLFYLKDEKQEIDLSALGLGTIQMPVYGELKMLLSQTYSATPLI